MQKRYRAILPSSLQPDIADDSTDQQQPKKRRIVRVACDSCRKSKIACDGKHPVCARCSRLNVTCQYRFNSAQTVAGTALAGQIDRLQQELSDHADILEHLRSVSEPEAIAVIRRLRSTPNASVVLSSLCGSAHTTTRLSELKALRGTVALTGFEAEAELSVLHQSVYPALKLPDLDIVDIDSLFQPALSRSTVPRAVGTVKGIEGTSSSTPDIVVLPPSPLRGTRLRQVSPVAGPAPDRQYCDSRLNHLEIDYWTCVPISNEFAACVLSHYLETDHPIFACVDADLFLSGLVDRTLEHCSPFLVSALMSLACQSYAQFDKRSSTFSIAFMDEAERLWRTEQRSQTSDTLAALSYLAIATGISGKDELGTLLAARALDLAQKMGLMGVQPTDQLVSRFYCLPPHKIKSLAFAAWGAYAWLTYRGIYYPIEPILYPPILPIPGDSDRQTDYGSHLIWPPHPLPIYMGHSFQTLSKLWVIIQEVNTLYVLTGNTSLESHVPLSFAESRYQSLLDWSDTLSPDMLQGEDSPVHVLFFHAVYHSTVLFLFQPFQNATRELRLRSFSSVDATPSAIYAASMKQLKHLVYAHHTRTPRLATECWFNTAIIRVSTEVIKNAASDPDWFFYFRLCVAFWKDAYRCYRSFRLIAQANLAAALQSGALRGNDASAMIEDISRAGKHHVASDEAVISGLLDFDLATRSIHDAQMVTIARQFDELLMFDELTTGEFDFATDGSV